MRAGVCAAGTLGWRVGGCARAAAERPAGGAGGARRATPAVRPRRQAARPARIGRASVKRGMSGLPRTSKAIGKSGALKSLSHSRPEPLPDRPILPTLTRCGTGSKLASGGSPASHTQRRALAVGTSTLAANRVRDAQQTWRALSRPVARAVTIFGMDSRCIGPLRNGRMMQK